MGWVEALRKSRRLPRPGVGNELLALRKGIALLSELPRLREDSCALPEHPFDSGLLKLSPLYLRSREAFLERGGRFQASLVSSPRTLGSPTLLENFIEYSPVARELCWAATDPVERRNPNHLRMLRSFVTSVFHEQNHRIIWSFMPPPSRNPEAIRRYLNFIESLAIVSDMALGDELGTGVAGLFYLIGLTYDRGSEVRSEGLSRREYRNYLHAAQYATYLNLEMYNPEAIPKVISVLYPSRDRLSERAAVRSAGLDRAFVHRTNPIWQKKHGARTLEVLTSRAHQRRSDAWRGTTAPVEFGKELMDNHQQYLLAERWFELLGL